MITKHPIFCFSGSQCYEVLSHGRDKGELQELLFNQPGVFLTNSLLHPEGRDGSVGQPWLCRGSRQVGCGGTAVSPSPAVPRAQHGAVTEQHAGDTPHAALPRGQRCRRGGSAPSGALPALNMAAAPASKMAAAAPRPRRKAARRALHGRGRSGHLYGSGRCPGPAAGGCPWLPTAS